MSPNIIPIYIFLTVVVSSSLGDSIFPEVHSIREESSSPRDSKNNLDQINLLSQEATQRRSHDAATHQRPTNFVSPNSNPSNLIAYSKGSIILPANNGVQAQALQGRTNTGGLQLPYLTEKHPNDWLNPGGLHTTRIRARTEHESKSDQGQGIGPSIDLALPPPKTIENFFQSPASFGATDHWTQATSEPSKAFNDELMSLPISNRTQIIQASSEPSNHIIEVTPIYRNRINSDVELQMVTTSTDVYHGFEQALNNSGSSSSSSPSTSVELNNQVVYEGPATAPPFGDYYFSASEGLTEDSRLAYGEATKRGRSSNNWWVIGIGHEYERASNLTSEDYREYCAKSELFVNLKQRSLCRSHPRIMPIVARGIKMAIEECQSRFSSNRWNCTLVLQDLIDESADAVDRAQGAKILGDAIKRPNRERAFLNAIIAAGLAHAMTKACSQDELPEECSCDKKIRSKAGRGNIEWVSCSDDIDYGARFSREFTDNTEADHSDTTAMINLHNYEVGRRVFKTSTDITCTCQDGENGYCQTKRCWKHLGPFKDIGEELLRRYDGATHVQTSNKDPHKLRPVRRGVRKPKRKDLVYIEESPDYCNPNTRLGVLGTQNRSCNSTSSGSDSCSLLCCGRGYQVVVEEIVEDCNCKFVWCCQIKCARCKKQVTSDVCN